MPIDDSDEDEGDYVCDDQSTPKRSNIIHQLARNEAKFKKNILCKLSAIKESAEKNELFSPADIDMIFPDVRPLIEISSELNHRFAEEERSSGARWISTVFSESWKQQMAEGYLRFCVREPAAQIRLQQLLDGKCPCSHHVFRSTGTVAYTRMLQSGIKTFLEDIDEGGSTLQNLLRMPFHHLVYLQDQLTTLATDKITPSSHPEYDSLQQAKARVDELFATATNGRSNCHAVIDIEARIDGLPPAGARLSELGTLEKSVSSGQLAVVEHLRRRPSKAKAYLFRQETGFPTLVVCRLGKKSTIRHTRKMRFRYHCMIPLGPDVKFEEMPKKDAALLPCPKNIYSAAWTMHSQAGQHTFVCEKREFLAHLRRTQEEAIIAEQKRGQARAFEGLIGGVIESRDLTFKSGGSLGRGNYADVKLAQFKGVFVAVKCFRERETPMASITKMRDEAMAMAGHMHPNLVRMVGAGMFPDQMPFLVLEYVELGDLQSMVQREHENFSWGTRKKFVLDVAAGLAFMHGLNHMHRDLKAENCLVARDYTVKVADFGEVDLDADKTRTRTAMVGSRVFMAPEVMDAKFEKAWYNRSVDVYSFAMVMYEVATAKVPFFDWQGTNVALSNHIISGGRPTNELLLGGSGGVRAPETYRHLMERCWSQCPEERPTFDEIVKDQLRTNLGQRRDPPQPPPETPPAEVFPPDATPDEVVPPRLSPGDARPDELPVRRKSLSKAAYFHGKINARVAALRLENFSVDRRPGPVPGAFLVRLNRYDQHTVSYLRITEKFEVAERHEVIEQSTGVFCFQPGGQEYRSLSGFVENYLQRGKERAGWGSHGPRTLRYPIPAPTRADPRAASPNCLPNEAPASRIASASNATSRIRIAGREYLIDVRRRIQINPTTGFERKIKHEGRLWAWQNDSGSYTTYSPEESKQIDKMRLYLSGPGSVFTPHQAEPVSEIGPVRHGFVKGTAVKCTVTKVLRNANGAQIYAGNVGVVLGPCSVEVADESSSSDQFVVCRFGPYVANFHVNHIKLAPPAGRMASGPGHVWAHPGESSL